VFRGLYNSYSEATVPSQLRNKEKYCLTGRNVKVRPRLNTLRRFLKK
jgi:hypothetical protein